jgi:hypothetical protein
MVATSSSRTWITALAIDRSSALLSWVSDRYQDNSRVVIDIKNKNVAMHLIVSILLSCFCVFGWSCWTGTT